jgi:hypothetical protein
MRGHIRESEPVETPPHQAKFLFALSGCGPLPARGARDAAAAASDGYRNVSFCTRILPISPT